MKNLTDYIIENLITEVRMSDYDGYAGDDDNADHGISDYGTTSKKSKKSNIFNKAIKLITNGE